MSKLLDDLIKYLDSEEGKLSMSKFFEKEEFNNKLIDKYVEKFNKLKNEERNKIILKIKNKYESDEYINREYKIGVMPRYFLGEYLFEYAQKYGVEINSVDDEYFPEKIFVIDNKWEIGYIYGQGTIFILREYEETK